MIGNIANEGVYPRNEILKLHDLLDIMKSDLSDQNLIDVILWSLSLLFREEPYISKSLVSFFFIIIISD